MEKSRNKKSILVVDDDNDLRNSLCILLRTEGYKVFNAESGNQALELLKAQSFDLILSDIRMPNGTGIELLDYVKINFAKPPVILMMTGFSELSLEDAYNKGAEALFAKPIDSKALFSLIDELLFHAEHRWAHDEFRGSAHEILVSLQFQDLPHALEANVVRLGRGGMFVAINAEHFPKVNDAVDFKIKLGTLTLEGTGIVRWARPHGTQDFPSGCGIEFLFLPEEHRKAISDALEVLNPKAYIPNR